VTTSYYGAKDCGTRCHRQGKPSIKTAPSAYRDLTAVKSRNMSFQKTIHSHSSSVLASGLATSQVTHHRQFPINPWSTHAPPVGHSQSPFLRSTHALFPNATVDGYLFLFGGWIESSESFSNDLHMISTRDFSSNLLETTGDVPEPRCGHCAVLTNSTLLIWGGGTDSDFVRQGVQDQRNDDSFYVLNLGM
jgi:hypothetical protein